MLARIASQLRSERGLAVPTALVGTAVVLGLAGAAVAASVQSQHGTIRDRDTKIAIAAADGAIETAIHRQNMILTTDALPCLVLGLGADLLPGLPGQDGWCGQVSGTVGTASWTYRVKPATLLGLLLNRRQVEVVATGTHGGVTRRANVTAVAPTGDSVFNGKSVIGLDDVTVNNNAQVVGSAQSGADMHLQNLGKLCGDATVGVGRELIIENSAIHCPGFATDEEFLNLGIPNQGSVPPSGGGINDNGRFFSQDRKTGNVRWNQCGDRCLELHGNGTLTLGGNDYSVCRLIMDGSSSLIIARNATVRVWFDTPENCGLPAGTEQISITGSSRAISTSQDPKRASFILVGSDTLSTRVNITGVASVQHEMLIYGPRTDVELGGTSTYLGAIAGQTVTVGGTSTVLGDTDINVFGLEILPVYYVDRYVECTGSSGSPPDANC